MIYAKYINEMQITRCPKKGKSATEGMVHTNLPRFYDKKPNIAQADGYLPLTETPIPEMQDGFYPTAVYIITDGIIVQSWTMTAIDNAI